VLREAGRQRRGHEGLGVVLAFQRCLQVGDVGRERLLADVLDRPTAHQPGGRAQHGAVHCGLEVAVVVLGEVGHFPPPARRLARRVGDRLESGEPFGQVRGEPALALFAVVDDVQPGLDLLADAILDGLSGAGLERLPVVGLAVLPGAH
jgi:hypothetical protein